MYTPLAIGAPNTYSATRVLLLGAGELGRELTIALQRMGVEVHAADRYQGAPAHNVANKSYVLDLMEADGLRELIEQVRPHFIVPEIEALALNSDPRAVAVSRNLRIPRRRFASAISSSAPSSAGGDGGAPSNPSSALPTSSPYGVAPSSSSYGD